MEVLEAMQCFYFVDKKSIILLALVETYSNEQNLYKIVNSDQKNCPV